LEQGSITSGSTWHAAGLVGQLRSSALITRVLKYSVDLYKGLEAETGLATTLLNAPNSSMDNTLSISRRRMNLLLILAMSAMKSVRIFASKICLLRQNRVNCVSSGS